MNLGQLYYFISELAVIARQFDISSHNGMNVVYTIEQFQSIINETGIQQDNIFIDYNSWSYCKSSEIVKNDIIPYVTFENHTVIKFTNLFQFTDDIITNVIFI